MKRTSLVGAVLAGTILLMVHTAGCTGTTALSGTGNLAPTPRKTATPRPTTSPTRAPGTDNLAGDVNGDSPTPSPSPTNTVAPGGNTSGSGGSGTTITPVPGGGGSTTGGSTNPTPAPVLTPTPSGTGGGTSGGGDPATANNPYFPLESSDIKLLIGSAIVGNTVSTIYEPAPDGNNSLNKPTSIKLTASVLLNNLTTDSRAKWESKNKLIATVDANGLVTAVGRGRTEIVARPADDLSYPAGFTVPTAQAIIEVKAIGAIDLVVE